MSLDLEISLDSKGMDVCSSSTQRYKVFLSHSGHQEDFVTQLCVDLERFNYFPFFERRPDIFQIGESYASLIQQVARQCSVVVIVLSKDYVVSKRTMVELSTFVQFQKTENPDLKLLPLLYHFSPSDLNEEHLFKEHWEELVEGDKTINVELWIQSIRVLRATLSLVFNGDSDVEFRANVVCAINHIIQDSHHASKMDIMMWVCKFLGEQGMGDMRVANLYKALSNNFPSEQGRDNQVILRALKTLSGLSGVIQDQSPQPYLSFGNEEQKVLKTCLQEWFVPKDYSPPKQYHAVALKEQDALLLASHIVPKDYSPPKQYHAVALKEQDALLLASHIVPKDYSPPKQYHEVALKEQDALLLASHTDTPLSDFSPVSQNVYVLPLLQDSQGIFEKTSLNNVPRALRVMDIEDLDKTWLVRFNTCGGASKSNQLNTSKEIVYVEKHFNLGLKAIIQAMAICEQMLEDLCLGHKIVTVYCAQWQYLVNSLSTRIVEQFTHYHSIMARLRGLVPKEGDKDLEAGMKVLTFCIQSLVELAQSLEHGLVLLSTCRRKEWWRTVLRMPNVALDLKKRRRNLFCVVLQQCEWSLDLVKLAFGIVQEHFTSSHAFKLKTVSFKWSNVKNRLLLVDGHSHVEDQRDETNKVSLVEVEKKDSAELIASLDNILPKFKSNWRPWPWPWVAKVKEQEQKIISFLKMKLEGPTPNPTYASYSIQVDPGDLKIKDVVGNGSFGVVLKVEWMGEEVAVKRMEKIHRKVFEAEAAILAAVQHPNIVHLIGCSFVEKTSTGMLVMELMEQDLRALINSRNGPDKVGPFPVIVAIDIMLQVAEAMQHLRECRILHRDLKAANILVSRQNPFESPLSRKKEAMCEEVKQWMLRGKEDHFVVKLADFGLAKYQAHTSRFMTKMAGTGPWRAPEVFKADISSTEYKWPADVYSFGVTCFEILTGDLPFNGVSLGQLYEKIKSGERPSIDCRFPTCVTQLIKRCWATEPLDRPDFSQICKDLWLCKLEQFGLEVCAN